MSYITTIKGSKSGPITIIMGGVHGNEPAGIDAIQRLKERLKIDEGKVYLILANPEACKQEKRYIDYDMNRCFIEGIESDGYEVNRAKEIIPYLKESNYLLDIHNTTIAGSEAFLICEHKKYTKYFNVPKIVSGCDVLHPGGTDGFMNSIGNIGICLEAGSTQQKKNQLAIDSILNFLKATGNIKGIPKTSSPQNLFNLDYLYKNQSPTFRLTKSFSDFESVLSGDSLGRDGDEEIFSKKDGFILFPSNAKEPGKEVFCTGQIL